MRTAKLLNLTVLGALFAGSILAWPYLPGQIPAHFGLDGTPERWAETTPLAWFAMPLVALGANLLLYISAFLASRNTRYLSIPDKERLLSLPPERQQPVLEALRVSLQAVCLPLTLVFCLVQVATYRAALGGDTLSMFIAILVLSAIASPAMAIGLLLRIQSEINRQVRQDAQVA